MRRYTLACGYFTGRDASDGIDPIANEGRGFGTRAGRDPRRQREQGPDDGVAGECANGVQAQLERVRILWQQDVQAGNAGVSLPAEVEKKYPNAAREWPWQYVFPAPGLSHDPMSGRTCGIICKRTIYNGNKGGCQTGWINQRCDVPHVAAFVCHASAGKWL